MPVSHGRKSLFLFFLLVTVLLPCFPNGYLSIEIWCELEPMSYDLEPHEPLTEAEAYRLAFEEARDIFSGMIYGFEFTYIPSDKARGVEEYFELVPVALIEWGDKNLRMTRREISDNRLYTRFIYELEAFQESRIRSWQTLSIPVDMGQGEGKLILGKEGRRLSRSQAVKNAIRNLLRPKIFNKPREIKGKVLLLQCPETILHAGLYITTVKVKIDVKEIIPYIVY